ncbi:hypothetical protein GRAN_4021 [Granulicella sibirica]|uniref:Uncharacterized protein n=1 Tax=Granulicella sibirica TaxID=2479048 RepID=A0A4Q0SVU5_9BACT|nr:hypothetical protein GRAN_4021 [Granulicella sibirica]
MFPQSTDCRGAIVSEVLPDGNHGPIRQWCRAMLEKTLKNRPRPCSPKPT